MKTYEEKWTAWLDGELSGRELIEFESALPDLAAAEAEKRDAQKLGAFLKKEMGVQALSNEEFFSHQLRERIARETETETGDSSGTSWWTIPRLALAGATALVLFLVCSVAILSQHQSGEQSEYLTQILNSKVDPAANPNATVSIFEVKNDNKVTVLWTEGLQSLPSDYAAK